MSTNDLDTYFDMESERKYEATCDEEVDCDDGKNNMTQGIIRLSASMQVAMVTIKK